MTTKEKRDNDFLIIGFCLGLLILGGSYCFGRLKEIEKSEDQVITFRQVGTNRVWTGGATIPIIAPNDSSSY